MPAKKKRGGRPTKMTKTTLGKLRAAFLYGLSDREACLYAEINPDTLYAYQQKHPEFSEQKRLWKTNLTLHARRKVYGSIVSGNLKTCMWYLERKARDEFGKATRAIYIDIKTGREITRENLPNYK